MSQLLQANIGPQAMETVRTAELAPVDAAARILMNYLGELSFGHGKETFRLTEVLDEWPSFGDEFVMPSASVLAMPPDDGADVQLVPEMLEETADCFGPGTVLWKTDEHSIPFQVDFWAQNKLQRQAIQAVLDAAFSPTEIRTGVILEGLPEYWDHPIRAVLERLEKVDTKEDVASSSRRLRAVIRCDVDALHLRRVTRLDPRVIIDSVQS